MTLWRIKDGIPSAADAFLVVGGFLGASVICIPCMEPILSVFEPLGLVYLGYFLALLVMLISATTGVWIFLRNENKLRWEVIIPRRVFGITSAPIIFLICVFTNAWAFRAGLGFFEHLALLVICFIPIFAVVVRISLRFPQRAAEVAIWFQVSIAGLGVLAKFVSLVIKR